VVGEGGVSGMYLDKTSKGELSMTSIDCCIELGEASRYTEDDAKLHVASDKSN